ALLGREQRKLLRQQVLFAWRAGEKLCSLAFEKLLVCDDRCRRTRSPAPADNCMKTGCPRRSETRSLVLAALVLAGIVFWVAARSSQATDAGALGVGQHQGGSRPWRVEQVANERGAAHNGLAKVELRDDGDDPS